MFFDPMYLVYIAPALLLAFWAKSRMMSAYHEGHTIAAPLSGAARGKIHPRRRRVAQRCHRDLAGRTERSLQPHRKSVAPESAQF